MNLNPEFERQLYLECSQARLIGIPLVLWAVFTLTYFLDGYRLGGTTAGVSLFLFGLICFLWGARQTVDSMMDELQEHTWDTQRLSALPPWKMAWGKLFGSTVMAWYGGFICLMAHALASEDPAALPLLFFYGVGSALLVQSGSFLLAQLAAQRGQNKTGSIFMLAVIGFLFTTARLSDIHSLSGGYSSLLQLEETTNWYGLQINSQLFQQFGLLSALAWCYIGNYRLMSQQLGMRALPWIWPLFTLYLIIYLGGLAPDNQDIFALAAFAICSALTYLSLLMERNDAMRLKRLLLFAQQGDWRRFAEEIPLWWLSYALTLPFALLLSFSEQPLKYLSTLLHVYPLPILLLLLRDCSLYLYFSYGKQPQRALSLTLVWGVLLYAVIPGIFGAMGQTWLAAAAFPLRADTSFWALFWASLQSGLLLNLLYKRWKASV